MWKEMLSRTMFHKIVSPNSHSIESYRKWGARINARVCVLKAFLAVLISLNDYAIKRYVRKKSFFNVPSSTCGSQ